MFWIENDEEETEYRSSSVGSLIFDVGGREVLRFNPDGSTFVHGQLTDIRHDIYDAMREYLGLPSIDELAELDEEQTAEEGCPHCGHRGEFVNMALVCPDHGPFGGL